MGQIFGNLTNSGVYDPASNQTQFGPPQEIPAFLSKIAAKQAQPGTSSLPDDVTSQDAPTDPTPVGPQPKLVRPSFLQAVGQTNPATGMPVSPLQNPALSKGGKLLALLGAAGQGALAGRQASEEAILQSGGRRAGGVGMGFSAGYQLPFLRAMQQQQVAQGQAQTQIAQQQARYFPQIQQLGISKTISDINKSNAEAGKAGAEAAAVPTKQALENAQMQAAFYKDDPNLGLIDLRTGQPVNSAGFAPLSPEEAAILGKQPGEQVPLKLKNTANEMVNRGIRTVNAGGRSLLVDSKGNTIKDMGAASNVVSFNLQNTASSADLDSTARALADGSMKWSDVLASRAPLSQKVDLLKRVKAINPQYNSGDFDVEKRVREAFTSGPQGQQLTAIDTSREHMQTYKQLASALDNGNFLLANQLGQAFGTQFGSDKATNFQIARAAFAGEVGKAFAGANVGEGDRRELLDKINQASSPKQLMGYADTADQLLAGKQTALKRSYQAGTSGQPNFGQGGASAPPAGATHAVIVNGKVIGYTADGKTMTPVQ